MTSKSKNITNYRKLGGKIIINNVNNYRSSQYVFPDVISEGRHQNEHHWQIKVGVIDSTFESSDDEYYQEIMDDWFESKEMEEHLQGYIIVDKWIIGTNVNENEKVLHEVVPTIITKGKNLGKINATNVFTQGLSEAYSMRENYIDRNAKNKSREGVTLYPPMLANKAESLEKIIESNDVIYQQPKFNGVRAVITFNEDLNVIIYSRQLKEYTQFEQIKTSAKKFITDGMKFITKKYNKNNLHLYIDGELYLHGVNLQDISGVARKQNTKKEMQLDYYCYDCFIPELPELIYSERKVILDKLFATEINYLPIKQVVTWEPISVDEIKQNHKQCLDEKYEGSMLRLDLPYVYSYKGYHCNALLKIKPKLDAEFIIVDFFAADRGKAKGCLMWTCQVTSKITKLPVKFNVTPMGTLVSRKKMFVDLSAIDVKSKKKMTVFETQYKGKPLTIQFDELSADGVPVRGNAVAIRDYE